MKPLNTVELRFSSPVLKSHQLPTMSTTQTRIDLICLAIEADDAGRHEAAAAYLAAAKLLRS